MATDTISSYQLKNAYTKGRVSFDVEDKIPGNICDQSNMTETDIPAINSELSMTDTPTKDWDTNVCGLVSSKKWLLTYGLQKNRLDTDHLLSAMGFKLSDDFDFTLKRPVASRYASGLFNHALRPDGKTFNITADKDKLTVLEARLRQAILLYRRRLDWLTTESRRIFGVIEEKCVVIVLDIRNLSPHQFNQYRSALERVLREQVSQLTKFNIIRAAEDLEMYNPDCLPVTHDTIEGAVQWLWSLDRLSPISKTSTCEAVMNALRDKNAEAVYLFTEGDAVDGSREILKEKISHMQKKTAVHVISYNCTDSDTIRYLKELSQFTKAKFHAYAVTMEMDIYESLPVNPKNSRANIVLKRKTYGGVPPGAGVREDVLLVFEEMEKARSNLDQVKTVLDQLPDPKFVLPSPAELPLLDTNTKIPKEDKKVESREEYLSSVDWLKTHGLASQKLSLYDILGGVVFKHQDGVVNVLEKPGNDGQTDAVGHEKLINARYCDRFPVVRWKDDRLVHVQVSPEIHRTYEQKIHLALDKIQQRINWLQQGSRELFGTVLEERIYILIDTSSSMIPHMQFIKDKLYLLLQEQLRHKMKFNLVNFNSRISCWRDRLMDVTETNLQSAWSWIQGLTCQGSTNTYTALQTAISDNQTQAIYLLTDGRPDQPPKSVLAQVQMQNRVPIHTISFNCNDTTANQFLCQLASTTNGRFHYFNETGIDIDIPEKYESEDIRLLKDEYNEGIRSLEKVGELRDQCVSLAWKQEVDGLRKSKNNALLPKQRRSGGSLTGSEFRDEMSTRPRSAPPSEKSWSPSTNTRPSTALGTYDRPKASLNSPRMSKISLRPPTASHTRTSLLRTLTSSGRFTPNAWLLPETREVLDKQTNRQANTENKAPEEYDKFKDILEPRGLVAAPKVTKRLRKKLKKRNSIVDGDKELTIKQWLGRYGLTAKKLTVIDALSLTCVPHKAKYVPILNKHVLAKVFNNILPLAHVTGRDKNQIDLVNPNAVNLQAYEDKLQDAIQLYTQKLDQTVWDGLPAESKTEFDSQEPVSFIDNKIKMMKLLKECNWPVSAKDINLLESEINRAERFLQQSRDLRGVAQEHQERKERSRESTQWESDRHKSRDITPLSSDRSVVNKAETLDNNEDQEDKSDKQEKPEEDDVYEAQARIVSAISRDQEEINQEEEKGMSERSEKKKKDGLGKRKAGPSWIAKQKVIARKETDGLYYAGVVIKPEKDRQALIGFDDGHEEVVPVKYMLPVAGALACPLLRVGDYVLVKVLNTDTEVTVYVPGVVQVTPRRIQDSTNFYTILTYNAQRVTTQRNHLIKVTKVRFELCCRYIRQQLMADQDPPQPSPSSDKENQPENNEDVADGYEDLLQRIEDQQDQLEDHDRLLRKTQNKLARLRRKQRKMADKKFQDTSLTKEEEKMYSDEGEASVEVTELRQSLAPLNTIGEEVLARWPDDGWYYIGTIQSTDNGSYLYAVEDCDGSQQDIWREDIITESDRANHEPRVSDAVIAPHPEFSFSYAPARVQDNSLYGEVKLQFYDGVNTTVGLEEVYPLDQRRYQEVVTYIQECDSLKIGQSVVARDDLSGYYQPGVVKEKVGDKSQFIVQWPDGSSSIQNIKFIFGKFTKRYKLTEGERVLGLYDRKEKVFLPGIILEKKDGEMSIKFCDGKVRTVKDFKDNVHCFWLSETFYDDAVTYYKYKGK